MQIFLQFVQRELSTIRVESEGQGNCSHFLLNYFSVIFLSAGTGMMIPNKHYFYKIYYSYNVFSSKLFFNILLSKMYYFYKILYCYKKQECYFII